MPSRCIRLLALRVPIVGARISSVYFERPGQVWVNSTKPRCAVLVRSSPITDISGSNVGGWNVPAGGI